MFVRSILSFCVALILFILVAPTPVHAANFTTDYRVTYNATETGTTHAVLNITLTNTTSDFYASSYKMQLGFDDIKNIKAADPDGPIKPTITKTPDGYSIDLRFNKRSVGLDSKLNFVVEFDTETIAKRSGKVWEINIPGIANPDEFKTFIVEVRVPPSYGKAAYIKPKQATDQLIFTKEQLGKSGISVAFGDQQIYDFALTYHISNTNLFPTQTEIALPPSTNYQDVSITTIQPAPLNVIEDKDGNWLAQYKLMPSQRLDVLVKGKAQVNLYPKPQSLSKEDEKVYLAEQPYWQTKSPEIIQLAKDLQTPEAIYNYVAKTLKYDFSRVADNKPRLGALDAIKKPNSAVCREFTDLFIAIARAAGIPAREVNGFAYTENARQRPLSLVRDILHAWPEYYDKEKKTWVMVDPTWGSTTGGIDYFSVLDFDHFAFAIKGYESSYPIPAGGYKFDNGEEVKDVSVSFSDNISDKSTGAEVTTTIPQRVMGGFPIKGQVNIKNTGTTYIPSQIMYITSTTLTPNDQMFTTAGIPPYGTTSVAVGFHSTKLFTSRPANFAVKVAGATTQQPMQILPFILNGWIVGGAVGVTLLALLSFWLVQNRLRK